MNIQKCFWMMRFKSFSYLLFFSLLISYSAAAQKNAFPIVTKTAAVSIVYDGRAAKLDSILANLLAEDIERVTSFKPKLVTDISKAKGNVIIIGSVQSTLIEKIVHKQSTFYKKLNGKWECFGLAVVDRPTEGISKALVIAGSDARGTAYGVFTLSEKIGVSPWYWWADAPVKKQSELTITQNDFISTPPSVKYRGIFINDEDWGMQPWAAKTFEPETKDIGPKTYAKVFELLLRLKANMIWPAMHPSTEAFFHYPGNITTAEDYRITIGSSHAEPMLSNNVGEWKVPTMGRFNYFTNKEKIYQYWEDRIKESRGIDAIYTLGMRGVHDGQMEGIKDLKEAVPVVGEIIQDQRQMLSKHLNKDATAIPQVLTPYKEVLEIYDNGLKVPDDVTLVWPDDNYGYIARLNNEKELLRKGGAGVYYHASYWGRPHDYLWLSSTHPSLIREEMIKAYETGADRVWVLNVGDIKPLEYNIQLFMDMAYDATAFKESSNTKKHLQQWASTVFTKEKGGVMAKILWEYFDLAFERRPEFMGWSQTEPNTKTKYTEFNHFYFGDEAQKRIDRYNALETEVKGLRRQIDSKYADAFYQLVYYPVVGASWINKKFLYRDKAYFYSKQDRLSAYDYVQKSKCAYDSIVKETEYYNQELANGKWKYIMSMKPRNLAVYQTPDLPELAIDSTSDWSIAPEGFVTKDSSLLENSSSLALPDFDNLNKQKYFVDIFLSKNQTVKWNASVSNNWIHLSQKNGVLKPELGNKQTRIWVDVDWNKFGEKGKRNGRIVFTSGGKQMMLSIQATKIHQPVPSGYNGFIENNGFVAMNSTHFSRKTNKPLNQWKLIDGLGYTGSALQVLPISIKSTSPIDPDSIKRSNAFVEYDFFTFSSATPSLKLFTLPAHPLNNNMSVRYGVSIDNGPLKIIDTRTSGRSEEWKQNVLRNYAVRSEKMQHINAGKHTLRIYTIDPGVVLDRILIDLGGLKSAYSVIPQTRQIVSPPSSSNKK
ncbi:MAG: glycosyl hydrolase 115 family protein [Ferruginibacter sp.]